MGKGDAQERELVSVHQDDDWFSRRATSSGGGMKQASYDVIAAKDGRVFVYELKYRASGEYIYIGEDEVVDLKWVADKFGGVAVLVGRWKQDTNLYCFLPQQVPRTGSGSYRLSPDMKEDAAFIAPPDLPNGSIK